MLTLKMGEQLARRTHLLHGAMLIGMGSPWAHPLLLAHLGLFRLWQPLWRGEREVGAS